MAAKTLEELVEEIRDEVNIYYDGGNVDPEVADSVTVDERHLLKAAKDVAPLLGMEPTFFNLSHLMTVLQGHLPAYLEYPKMLEDGTIVEGPEDEAQPKTKSKRKAKSDDDE